MIGYRPPRIRDSEGKLLLYALGIVAVTIALMCLFGCAATPQIEYVPQRVEVPVLAKPPPVIVPPRPHLAVEDLTDTSTDAEVAAAWRATCEVLKDDDKGLRALLTPYQ